MNKTIPLAATVCLLVTPVSALAQQAPRLSAQHLKQASPLIHWPRGLEPRSVDVFVHNEGWIAAPPQVVWRNLIEAAQWPSWYSNAADVRIAGGKSRLGEGASFDWRVFGFPITSRVDVFTPDREIGWNVDNPRFRVHRAWVLVPERGGTRVVTEEAQKGPDAIRFRLEQPNAMYDGHDWWLSALRARSERMARR